MSEKRQTPDDPRQLKLGFEGIDLTDEEKRQIEGAARKVTESRKVRVREHEKQMPLRKKLPENLRHVEEHIYPDGYLGHKDEWILFNDVETSEHLEITAPDAYVRVIIRHKAMRKSDNKIFTATAPAEPLAKSYAGPTALTELTIGKFADHLPFYRQIAMFKCLGIELKQPTIEGWFFGIADLMRPMYYRLQEYMLQLDYLQSDESTVRSSIMKNIGRSRAICGSFERSPSPWCFSTTTRARSGRRSRSSFSRTTKEPCKWTYMLYMTCWTSSTG